MGINGPVVSLPNQDFPRKPDMRFGILAMQWTNATGTLYYFSDHVNTIGSPSVTNSSDQVFSYLY